MPTRKVLEVRTPSPKRDRRAARTEETVPTVEGTGFRCPVCYLKTPCQEHPWVRSRRDRNRR